MHWNGSIGSYGINSSSVTRFSLVNVGNPLWIICSHLANQTIIHGLLGILADFAVRGCGRDAGLRRKRMPSVIESMPGSVKFFIWLSHLEPIDFSRFAVIVQRVTLERKTYSHVEQWDNGVRAHGWFEEQMLHNNWNVDSVDKEELLSTPDEYFHGPLRTWPTLLRCHNSCDNK